MTADQLFSILDLITMAAGFPPVFLPRRVIYVALVAAALPFGTQCTFITFALFRDKTPTPDDGFRGGLPRAGTAIAPLITNETGLMGSAGRLLPVVIRPNCPVPIVYDWATWQA